MSSSGLEAPPEAAAPVAIKYLCVRLMEKARAALVFGRHDLAAPSSAMSPQIRRGRKEKEADLEWFPARE